MRGKASTDSQEMQGLSSQVFRMQNEKWTDGARINEQARLS